MVLIGISAVQLLVMKEIGVIQRTMRRFHRIMVERFGLMGLPSNI